MRRAVTSSLALAALAIAALHAAGGDAWLNLHKVHAATRMAAGLLWHEAVTRSAIGYAHSPEIMLGLALAFALPLLGLASMVLRSILRWHEREQRAKRLESAAAADRRLRPRGRAWLEISEAGTRRQVELAGELTRIGRDVENELPLNHQGIDPFHALIRRTVDAEYLIVDVSGATEGGLTVNGNRRAASRLDDGDLIKLGRTSVTFRRMTLTGSVT